MSRQNEKSSEKIVTDLREKIIRGTIAPKTRLTHRDIADKYGVSIFPARDALRILMNEGMVVQPSPKTIIVTPVTSSDFIDIMEMRALLEPRALELSGPRLTKHDFGSIRSIVSNQKNGTSATATAELHWSFHKALYKRAGRPRLIETIDNLNINLIRYLVPIWATVGVGSDWVEGENELLNLVEKNKYNQAVKLLRKDIDRSTLLVLKNLTL